VLLCRYSFSTCMPKMFPYPGHMKKTNHSVYEVCFTGILDHQLYTNLIQSFRHLSFDLIDIFSIYELTLILKNIGQCYVKHIITIMIKTITSVFKVSTYIATIGINSSYQTCCDTPHNVCLDLQNCHYSIYIDP
jgi:hypothetical protein